jgi:glycogen synthase kinase 3 beta
MNNNFKGRDFPHQKVLPLEMRFLPDTDPQAISLLKRILVWSPAERPSALELLKDPYFDELRNKNFKHSSFSDLFRFTKEEWNCAPNLVKDIIPAGARHLNRHLNISWP